MPDVFLSHHKCICVLHIYGLLHSTTEYGNHHEVPSFQVFFVVVVLLHKRFHFMLQQMEIKELSNTKKKLGILPHYVSFSCFRIWEGEMHWNALQKKVCLNLFFFSLAWAPVIMSNNLEKEKERKRASFIYNKNRGMSITQTVQTNPWVTPIEDIKNSYELNWICLPLHSVEVQASIG